VYVLGPLRHALLKRDSTQAGRRHQLEQAAAKPHQPREPNAGGCCCTTGLVEETELAQLEHLLEQRSKRLYFQGLRAAGELPARLAAQHPALAPLSDKARRRLLQVGAGRSGCCGASRRSCANAARRPTCTSRHSSVQSVDGPACR
jgi:hypothetical protein